MIEIKSWYNGSVLRTVEADTLRDANLTDADLTDANLTDANLTDANLTDADLTDADLTDADLTDADLTGANLRDANLTDANLTGANLRDANLTGANLTGANLRDANLTGANLRDAKEDFFTILDNAPHEVGGLRLALMESRVNGLVYKGECACLVGTIANLRGCDYEDRAKMAGIIPDGSRPAERWFLAINEYLSYKHPIVKITIEWIDEWMAKQAEGAAA